MLDKDFDQAFPLKSPDSLPIKIEGAWPIYERGLLKQNEREMLSFLAEHGEKRGEFPNRPPRKDYLEHYQGYDVGSEGQDGQKPAVRYTVEGKSIGEGGLGSVYRAWDHNLERLVAVKVSMAVSRSGLAEDIDPTELEAKIMARLLNHPGIVQVYDFLIQDGKPMIIMEYMDPKTSPTLHKKLEDGPLLVSEIKTILQGLASTLHYIYGRGFYYGDLKSSNIFLAKPAKISDFGSVPLWEEALKSDWLRATGAYIVPELIYKECLPSLTSEVFTLGIIAYQMVTRDKHPFGLSVKDTELWDIQNNSYRSILGRIASTNDYSLERINSIDNVFRRALSKKPQDRFSTPKEFVDSLCSLL